MMPYRRILLSKAVACLILLAGLTAYSHAQTARDPWLWPFAANSIWNTPIGSGAHYVPANLGTLSGASPDPEFFVRVTSSDPTVTEYYPGAPRASGTGVSWLGSMQVPNGFLVADENLDPNHYSTPNDCSTFLQADGDSLIQLEPTTRLTASGAIWGFPQTGSNAGTGLHEDGMYGTHYGSGLSSIGGSIRQGEISSVNPIRHAIKIELTWTQLYWNSKDSTNDYNTYRWPAKNSDSGADGQSNSSVHYSGTNSSLREGSLLAILPGASEQSLNLSTAAGKKLFHAFQDYGAYVVDTSGNAGPWMNLAVEDGVQNIEIPNWGGSFNTDMAAIYANLQVVDNNTSSSVGGGGTARVAQPLAIGTNITPTANAMYRLVNQLSTSSNQLCLDVSGGSNQPGANVQVWTCNGLGPQNWILKDAGNGYFEFINQQSGLCLDDSAGGTAPGTNVQQYTCLNADTQYWKPTFVGGGYFTLYNQHSGLMLDDSYSGTTPGNNVWLYTANPSSAQRWLLQQQ